MNDQYKETYISLNNRYRPIHVINIHTQASGLRVELSFLSYNSKICSVDSFENWDPDACYEIIPKCIAVSFDIRPD